MVRTLTLLLAAVLAASLYLVASPVQAATAEAMVGRTLLLEGDVVDLTLRYRDGDGEEPNLAPLRKDFEILGVQSSRRFSMVNGNVDSSVDFIVQMVPRGTGSIIIPAINIGGTQTKPITLSVREGRDTVSDAGGDVFVESDISSTTPYVQEQLVYTLRIFHDVPLSQAALTPPESRDAIFEQLGEDSVYDVVRKGHTYRVIERRYAVFPQRSGTIEIPGTSFRAEISDGSDPVNDIVSQVLRNRNINLGNIPGLGGGRPVALRTDPVTLEVKAVPDDIVVDWWLPAQAVRLNDSWDGQNPQFRVGETVTRNIILEVKGAMQVPDLVFPEVAGIKQYPGRPSETSLVEDSARVVIKDQSNVIIPTQAGAMTLPALEIQWWDTTADQVRVASLPARRIEVLPALGVASDTAESTTTVAPAPVIVGENAEIDSLATENSTSAVTSASAQAANPMRIYGIATLIGILSAVLTFLAMRYFSAAPQAQTHQARSPEPVGPARQGSTISKLSKACSAGDAREAMNALIAWGAARWPDNPPVNVDELARRLGSKRLSDGVAALNKQLYAGGQDNWDGAAMRSALDDLKGGERPERDQRTPGPIPQLYPT